MEHCIKVGTVKGRHEMPVNDYLVEKVDNPTDIATIEKEVNESFEKLIDKDTRRCYLFITGLTSVALAAVKWCSRHNIEVVAMHYDMKSGLYFAQRVL